MLIGSRNEAKQFAFTRFKSNYRRGRKPLNKLWISLSYYLFYTARGGSGVFVPIEGVQLGGVGFDTEKKYIENNIGGF